MNTHTFLTDTGVCCLRCVADGGADDLIVHAPSGVSTVRLPVRTCDCCGFGGPEFVTDCLILRASAPIGELYDPSYDDPE